MHVHLLPVASIAVEDCRDDDQLVLLHKVAHASLVLCRVVGGDGVEIEFQGGCERNDDEQEATEQTE